MGRATIRRHGIFDNAARHGINLAHRGYPGGVPKRRGKQCVDMDIKPSPFDVILLVKQWASDTALSQPPLLLLPASAALRLCPNSLGVSVCRTITDSERKEFEKTASAVGKSPWNLHRAAAWLREYISPDYAPVAVNLPKYGQAIGGAICVPSWLEHVCPS